MRIECRSHAKINWTLEVLGQRPDGYHEIRTVLQTIALHDLLVLEKTHEQIEIICNSPSVPVDERNLVHRAAMLLRQAKGVQAGARINIVKRIPVGGGLGGGSSNAAAALLGLQELWQVRLAPSHLIELGAAIGSDVPCFFYGGTVLGVGRGAEVYPLPDIWTPHLLLVTPAIEVSTREIYAEASRRPELTSVGHLANIPDCCSVVYGSSGLWLNSGGSVTWLQEARNDLEAVVATRYPEIGRIRERLKQLGAATVRMSGSGSTVFAVFEHLKAVESATSELSGEPWQVIRTQTLSRDQYWNALMEKG